jgi:hypothetical protein
MGIKIKLLRPVEPLATIDYIIYKNSLGENPMKSMYWEKDTEEKKLKSYTQGCCLCAYVKRPECKPVDCCLEAYGIRK